MRYYVCDICGKEIPKPRVCSFKIKEKYASTSIISIDTKFDICRDCACDIKKACIGLIKEKREITDE